MPGSFFDTNVLLYLAASDDAKAERAEELQRYLDALDAERYGT